MDSSCPAFGPSAIEIDTEYDTDSILPSPLWTSASALRQLRESRRRCWLPGHVNASAPIAPKDTSAGEAIPEGKGKEKAKEHSGHQDIGCPCGVDTQDKVDAEANLACEIGDSDFQEALMKIRDRRYRGVRVERKIEKRIGKAIRLRRRKPDYSAQDERKEPRLRQPRPPPPSPPGTSTSDLMGKLGEIHFDYSAMLDRDGGRDGYLESLDFEGSECYDVAMKSPIYSPRQTVVEEDGQPSRVPTGMTPWIPEIIPERGDLNTCTNSSIPPILSPTDSLSLKDVEEKSTHPTIQASTSSPPISLGKSPIPYDDAPILESVSR